MGAAIQAGVLKGDVKEGRWQAQGLVGSTPTFQCSWKAGG